MNRELICIGCPMGCTLNVDYTNDHIVSVTGNTCNGGIKYATEEIFNPRRILTTTIRIKNSLELLSVKSSDTLPKNKLFDYIKEINLQFVNTSAKIGDIMICNIDNTGVDIVATKNIREK